MTQSILWHQGFSNYHNLNCQIKQKQVTRHSHNLTSNSIQLELSNEFGEDCLHIEQIKISEKADCSDGKSFSLHGNTHFSIPPHKKIWTDALPFSIQAGKDFFIEMTAGNNKGQINSLGSAADTALIEVLNCVDNELEKSFFFGISSVAAETPNKKETVAFFGDSLTNQGFFSNSTAKCLYTEFPNEVTTFNAGISGNRLLLPGTSSSEWNESFGPAGITRFDSDVLRYQPTVVVFMEGANDLFHPGAGCPKSELPNADELVEGIKKAAKLCKERKCLFIPMTITPFKGAENAGVLSWTPEKESIRKTVNQAIMKIPYAVDLAQFVADEREEEVLASSYDSGDHIHFSQSGGEAIGKFVYSNIRTLFQ